MGLTVGELSVELEARTREFRAGLSAAERRLQRFEQAGQRRTGGVARSFARLGGAITAVTAAVVALGGAIAAIGLGRFLAAGVRSAAAFESLSISLEVLTGTAEGAKEVLAEVERLTVRTPFSLEQMASSARSLAVVFGDNSDAISEFTARSADIGAAFQLEADIVGRQLTRAFNSGLASAEILRDSGITPLLLELAGVSDVSKLTREQFVEALRALTSEGGKAFQAAARQAKSLEGALSNTGIAFSTLRRASGAAIAPALQDVMLNILQPAFARLTELVEKNSDAINDMAARVFPLILGALESFARLIANTLRAIGFLTIAWDALQAAGAQVQLNLLTIVEAVILAGTFIKNMGDVTVKVWRAIAAAASFNLGKAKDIILSIGDDFDDVKNRAIEMGRNTTAAFSVVQTRVDEFGKTSEKLNLFADGLDKTTNSAKRLIAEVTAAGPIDDVIPEIAKADVTEFVKKDPKKAGEETADGFATGFADTVASAFSRGIAGESVDIVDSFATLLQSESEKGLKDAFESAINDFGSLLGGVLKDAGGAISGLFGGAEGPLGQIGGFLSSKLGDDAGKLLGSTALGILGAGVKAFRAEDEITSTAANVQSAVDSAERVRGIVAGPTSIAVAQVDRAISDSFIDTNRLLALIEENTRRTARSTSDSGTGSVPSGGTSEATQALANEGPSLV